MIAAVLLAESTFDYTLLDISWLAALLVIAGGVFLGLIAYQFVRIVLVLSGFLPRSNVFTRRLLDEYLERELKRPGDGPDS